MTLLYDNTLVIKRYKQSGSNIKRNYAATATAEVSLQPLGKESGSIQEGVFGRTFIAYMAVDVSVKKGDLVIDKNGVQYSVTDVVIRDHGVLPHSEVILKKN